ncbi:MAG: DUF1330 domain-containing protein [Erythrobacter sp.]|uniref:DUF1330 domain-containing protein n=1 Tax=Erythrobacter sp. TaxID=1042 RepID=UPI00262C1091|nr:DUF1330 domain-containing protein [Erythrobacter sp.]MDJ0977167.1 DUF1330 domain-containing protein [Erythrobacter sp.]
MSAFVIARISIKDPAKFQEYSQGLGPTLAQFGGKPVARGKLSEVLAGEADHMMAAVVEFESFEKAEAWSSSEAYQALRPIRDAAADVSMAIYKAG